MPAHSAGPALSLEFGPFGQVGTTATRNLTEEFEVKQFIKTLPEKGYRLENLVKGLYVNKDGFSGIPHKDNLTIEKVAVFLSLVKELEPYTEAYGEGYSFALKYIKRGTYLNQYILDVDNLSNFKKNLKQLQETKGIYEDQQKPLDEILISYKLFLKKHFTLKKGLENHLINFYKKTKQNASKLQRYISSFNENIKKVIEKNLTRHLNTLRGFDPEAANQSTQFLITNCLQITASIYSLLGFIEYLPGVTSAVTSMVSSTLPSLINVANTLTSHGIQIYMYLLNILVFAPSVSAYSLLYVVFLLKRFNLWTGLSGMIKGAVLDKLLKGDQYFKDKYNKLLRLGEKGLQEIKDFDEFLKTDIVGPLGGFTGAIVEHFKSLRFSGLNNKLDDFNGLTTTNRSELIKILTTKQLQKPPDMDSEYIPKLKIPKSVSTSLSQVQTKEVSEYITIESLSNPQGVIGGPSRRGNPQQSRKGRKSPSRSKSRSRSPRRSRSRSPRRSRSRTPPGSRSFGKKRTSKKKRR
jgi:hypothetical protein